MLWVEDSLGPLHSPRRMGYHHLCIYGVQRSEALGEGLVVDEGNFFICIFHTHGNNPTDVPNAENAIRSNRQMCHPHENVNEPFLMRISNTAPNSPASNRTSFVLNLWDNVGVLHNKSASQSNIVRAMISIACLIWLLACVEGAWSQANSSFDARAVDMLKQDAQLVPLSGGKTWVLQDELLLRRRLSRLPKIKGALFDHQKYLHRRIDENRRRYVLLQQVEGAYRRARSAATTSDDPNLLRIQEQLKDLRASAWRPDQLGGAPDVQVRLVDATNQRNRLWLSVMWIRRTTSELAAQYEKLHEKPDVLEAISKLGVRLGPLREYESDLRGLAEYEEAALQGPLPLFRESGYLRVGAILNEQTPVTFTFVDAKTSSENSGKNSGKNFADNSRDFSNVSTSKSSGEAFDEKTVVTSNMLETAGIKIPHDAPTETYVFGKRKLLARRITLPYLRFGECLLRDVSALALPPEGEDIGARISAAAFEGFHVIAEPELLRLRMFPQTTRDRR